MYADLLIRVNRRVRRSRQRQRYELWRVISRTARDDDALFAVEHVGHRSGGGAGWQIHLPDHAASRLVVGAEFFSPGPVGPGRSAHGVAALPEEKKCLAEERRRAVRIAEWRKVEVLQQRVESWS